MRLRNGAVPGHARRHTVAGAWHSDEPRECGDQDKFAVYWSGSFRIVCSLVYLRQNRRTAV